MRTANFFPCRGRGHALRISRCLLAGALSACGAAPPPVPPGADAAQAPAAGRVFTTDGVRCNTGGSEFNGDVSVQLTASYRWDCDGAVRRLSANGVPNHAVGAFPGPGNPHRIGAVATAASYTLQPALTGQATEVVTAGYALNGVKLEPGTAGTCDDLGRDCRMARSSHPWKLEALGQQAFNFGTDDSNGHVQPTGAYHYHGVPERLLARLNAEQGGRAGMTLVAWAPDGFPIYARLGHQVPGDAATPLVALRSSYRLKPAPDAGRPPVARYAMGTFTQDHEYVAGSGDLDECNGRVGVTPEFPAGTYHYLITDTFPFIGRCVKGRPASRR